MRNQGLENGASGMGERLGWAEASAPGSWQRDRGLLVSPKAERSPACCPGRDPRQNRGDPHAAAGTSWVCWWVTDPGSGLSSWPRGAELQCGPVWDWGVGGASPIPLLGRFGGRRCQSLVKIPNKGGAGLRWRWEPGDGCARAGWAMRPTPLRARSPRALENPHPGCGQTDGREVWGEQRCRLCAPRAALRLRQPLHDNAGGRARAGASAATGLGGRGTPELPCCVSQLQRCTGWSWDCHYGWHWWQEAQSDTPVGQLGVKRVSGGTASSTLTPQRLHAGSGVKLSPG